MRRIAPSHRELRLCAARMLSPSVRELTFESPDVAPIDHLAGQWFKLFLGEGVSRDYSVASAPRTGESARVVFAVTRVDGGPGSARLHQMPLGTMIRAQGPNGLFVREDAERDHDALYVGTGTGIAPLRSMIVDELAREGNTRQRLLFGCRSDDEVLYRDEFESLAREHARFEYAFTLSRPPSNYAGRGGWVQGHLDEMLASLERPHVYICGLSKMVQDVRAALKSEHGLDRKQIHSERYD